jgi:UDP-glucose 4-epimerase
MKILLIGSNGFIGSNALDYFIQQGHIVYHCDISQSDNRKNYLTINANEPDFNILFQEEKFDYCINASGAADVQLSFKDPAQDFTLNVFNVKKILEAIRTHNPGCKFINFSSAAIYGNPVHLPIPENAEPGPLSPYGWHKLQSEILCKEYFRCFNVNTISLRVFSAYGEGLKKQLFWDLYQKAKKSSVIELFGTGDETRDFIYIKDLLFAIKCVMQKAAFDGQAINIANGKAETIKNISEMFFKNFDTKIDAKFTSKIKTGDPAYWMADIGKLKRLGYNQTSSIETGLKNTAQWLINNQHD